MAAETERLRSALLTSISHDLRTPLASILGSATSLKNYRQTLSETAQNELIRTIQEEAERLNRFISNLLDMTRLESGALKPQAEFCDIGDIVGSALRRAGKVLARHRVVIDLGDFLPTLRLDPVLFEQVLINLPDNTAKYAPTGTEIRVSARQENGLVRVQVSDEGEGIRPGDLERNFEKFYRAHAGDSRRVGTGLGLAICRGFSRQWAAPSWPVTVRTDSVRCLQSASPLLPTAPRRRWLHDRQRHSTEGLRRRRRTGNPPLLRTSLTAQGYQVIEAKDGTGALEHLRRSTVDIMVLALGLPDINGLEVIEINGLEVIERLRNQGSLLPIIVLSSRTDEAGKVKALDLGADDYITKPFGIDELLARIRAALRHCLQQEGEQPVFRCSGLSMDFVRRIVAVGGNEVKLTSQEYDLLRVFVAHAGKVLTHKFILRELWSGDVDVQYLRVYIRALRQKIEPDPEQPRYILTEQGVGYHMRPPD